MSGGGAVCGNGFLEPGEFFTDPMLGAVGDLDGTECAADGQVLACTASTTRFVIDVNFEPAPGTSPTGFSIAIGYKSGVVSLPGTGLVSSVRGRVTFVPPVPTFFPNDRNYALRVLTTASTAFGNRKVYSVSFDLCTGAAPPTVGQFGCIVEGCTSAGGAIAGCSCTISLP